MKSNISLVFLSALASLSSCQPVSAENPILAVRDGEAASNASGQTIDLGGSISKLWLLDQIEYSILPPPWQDYAINIIVAQPVAGARAASILGKDVAKDINDFRDRLREEVKTDMFTIKTAEASWYIGDPLYKMVAKILKRKFVRDLPTGAVLAGLDIVRDVVRQRSIANFAVTISKAGTQWGNYWFSLDFDSYGGAGLQGTQARNSTMEFSIEMGGDDATSGSTNVEQISATT